MEFLSHTNGSLSPILSLKSILEKEREGRER